MEIETEMCYAGMTGDGDCNLMQLVKVVKLTCELVKSQTIFIAKLFDACLQDSLYAAVSDFVGI